MHSLLLFHKVIDGRNKWLFEARSMGCFNGLNTQDAFVAPKVSSVNLMLDSGEYAFEGEANSQYRFPPSDAITVVEGTSEEHRVQFSVGARLVALGWLADSILSSRPRPPVAISEGALFSHAIPNVMAYFNTMEHIVGPYNPWLGTQEQSHRQFTPNEHVVKNLLRHLHTHPKPVIDPDANTQIDLPGQMRLLATLCHSRRWYFNMLFDFVGSERPSGTAVAYLQVFRNVSRAYTSEYQISNADLRFAKENFVKAFMRSTTGTRYKSAVPILSQMFNHGGDSDILSFSGSYVLPFATKFGYFALQGLFGDIRSMVDTGRYVKGSQSNDLNQNVMARVQVHANAGLWTIAQRINPLVEQITMYSQRVQNFNTYCTVARCNRAYSASLDAFMDQVRQYAEPIFNTNLKQIGDDLFGLIAQFPDLRMTPESRRESTENRTAGSAADFTQWQELVSQTIQ